MDTPTFSERQVRVIIEKTEHQCHSASKELHEAGFQRLEKIIDEQRKHMHVRSQRYEKIIDNQQAVIDNSQSAIAKLEDQIAQLEPGTTKLNGVQDWFPHASGLEATPVCIHVA